MFDGDSIEMNSNKENEFLIKNGLQSHLKQLKELKIEKSFLEQELTSYEDTLMLNQSDQLDNKSIESIINNYSSQLSNLTCRFENTEIGFHKLLKIIQQTHQSSINPMDDSTIIKNLAQRLSQTIEMYELLNKKLKQTEIKLLKSRKKENDLKLKLDAQPPPIIVTDNNTLTASMPPPPTTITNKEKEAVVECKKEMKLKNYLNISKLMYRLSKFIKLNKINKTLFSNKILGISRVKFENLIKKNPQTKWQCAKMNKKIIFMKIFDFLKNKYQQTEFLNYCLIANKNRLLLQAQLQLKEQQLELELEQDEQYFNEEQTDYEMVNCDYENEEDDLDEDNEHQVSVEHLPEYLDTHTLSHQLYQYLKENNIKQIQFASNLLNLSKTSFNKMLLCPVKWSNCKPQTKENFYKISLFLNNPESFKHQLFSNTDVLMNDDDTHNEDENEDDGDDRSLSSLNENLNEISSSNHFNSSLDTHLFMSVDRKELCKRVHDFLLKYKINQTYFAQSILHVSRRSFNRLLNRDINWTHTKAHTKQYLIKLDQFLNDQNQINAFLNSIKDTAPLAIQNLASNGREMNAYSSSPSVTQVINENTSVPNMITQRINGIHNIRPSINPTTPSILQLPSKNSINTILKSLNVADIGLRAKKFLKDNNLSTSYVAQNLLGITGRSFNRLMNCTTVSLNNCKPSTKENLVKLNTFLNSSQQIKNFLDKLPQSAKLRINLQTNSFVNRVPITIQPIKPYSTFVPKLPIRIAPKLEPKPQQGDSNVQKLFNPIVINDNKDNLMRIVDIKALSKRIYAFLSEHKLSQRVFAQKLLGITKNRFNKLICNPPSWINCKSATKQQYYVIEHFLNDPKQIEDFLNSIQSEEKLNGFNHHHSSSNMLDSSNYSLNIFNATQNDYKENEVEDDEEGEEDIEVNGNNGDGGGYNYSYSIVNQNQNCFNEEEEEGDEEDDDDVYEVEENGDDVVQNGNELAY